MKYLFGLLLLVGCASKKVNIPANPLVKQILSPRKGYKTLTNTSAKDGVLVVQEYDLNDVQIRKNLKELGFRCNIAGREYFICANGPGFCRRENDKLTKLGPIVVSRKEQFAPSIDINERYQYLLDAKTRCESSRVDKIN